MRPFVRLRRLLNFRYWKPLEHLDDFLVRNLIKVSIIKADCAEDEEESERQGSGTDRLRSQA